jgi:hypothetical protein
LASAEVRDRVPAEKELDAWFLAEKERYTTPLKFDFEFFTVPRHNSDAELERLEQMIQAGEAASKLGVPLRAAHLAAAEIDQRLPVDLARAITRVPAGTWRRVHGRESSWLLRVKRVTGGTPDKSTIHALLVADWVAHQRQLDVDRILDRTVSHYHFEEQP